MVVEEIARMVWLTNLKGQLHQIPDEDAAKLHHRYTHVYGQ